jgi:hypothetical protein
MKLDQLGLTLRDVDLGRFDAESDYKLAEHFVTTPYVEAALGGQRTLFLGRKGSGKSSLFRQLPDLVTGQGAGRIVLQLTPDAYAWRALQEYREQGLLAEHAHTNAWKLTIGVEVAGRLAALDREWSPSATESIGRLRQFIQENFGELEPGLLKTASGLVKGLASFNLSAFGFGVGVSTREGASSLPITPALIQAIWDELKAPLSEQAVTVEFDRLDDSWDGAEQSQTLLIGLLKAAKDVNDSSASDEAGQCRILVFLRSDIYDGLKFDDKDKHRGSEEHILWSEAGLAEMLTRRLPREVTAADLFEAGEMRGRTSLINYLMRRTFLRPREILQFVDQCIRQSLDGASEITKEAIRAAEDLYSRWKVEDLKQEFTKASPGFTALLEALRQEVHRYDSIDDLEELLSRKAVASVERLGPRGAIEELFEASVIGVRLRGAGSPRFKSTDPELALPASGTVYVHQSLYRGLNIVEARKSSEEPSSEDQAF